MQTPKFFNTSGPVNLNYHYALHPLSRINLAEIELLLAQQKYFVLHAPRQTGKTSLLLALADHLNHQGVYQAVYANLEVGQSARENVESAMRAILPEIAAQAEQMIGDSRPNGLWFPIWQQSGEGSLNIFLRQWVAQLSKPLVLFLDEIDSLVGDTLIAVLRQIRAGYTNRPGHFPSTIVLCGVRDVRDYRLRIDEGKAVVTGGSAFNIKAKSLRLGNFSRTELETLYQQHTQETGQLFTPEAIELAWYLTQGQPWLVNALANEVIEELLGHNLTSPITADLIQQAKEQLILQRATHLDGLIDKLKEERVRQVIEPILMGTSTPQIIPTDDIEYAQDLGLISYTAKHLTIANPIYQEIIPRELTNSTQQTLSHSSSWYIQPNGRLDMTKLMSNFQQFFRENSEHWLKGLTYREAAPQLLLQAFLQRIINGGGRVEREYGLGRGRTDLLIIWFYGEGQTQREVIELKIIRHSLERTLQEGLEQTWEYLDRCGVAAGHLVLFNGREEVSWEEKIFQRTELFQGKSITVWGM